MENSRIIWQNSDYQLASPVNKNNNSLMKILGDSEQF